MATTVEQLAEQAMALPSESRARLADLLVESLNDADLGRIEELWLTEAKRRRDEVRAALRYCCASSRSGCPSGSTVYNLCMGEFKFEYADSSPCFHCGADMLLDVSICGSCDREVPPRITLEEILFGFLQGQLIDVRSGGLVLGRHDKTDDIPMWRAVANGVLQLSGLMHGGEYIVNWRAAEKHTDRLLEINAYTSSEYEPITNIEITDTTRIFNTNGPSGPESNLGVLTQGGQFIANRAATRKYLSELQEINDSVAPALG